MVIATGADGTAIEAERLVALVYGKPTKPLPYAGGNIDGPLSRMRGRWPQVRDELSRGRIGFTPSGGVAVRAQNAEVALARLVNDENSDRELLYQAISEEVGHGRESLVIWMPYTEETFGAEWIKQADSGWWYLDHQRQWRHK